MSAIKTSKPKADLKDTIQAQVRAFLCALQFLSSLPVGQQPLANEKTLGTSVTWYPVVGLVLGLILGGLAQLFTSLFNDWISAALLLTAWVGLTGALHLDGLADSADAWLGGLGSKARTLKLMKDPTSGPIAIATLVLVLLLKLVCLQALLTADLHWTILWALVFARANAVLLLMHTIYVREKGLGASLRTHLSAQQCYWVIGSLGVLSLLALSWAAWVIMLCAATSLYALRAIMLQRLEGCTGDTLGALIELSETLILLSLVACLI